MTEIIYTGKSSGGSLPVGNPGEQLCADDAGAPVWRDLDLTSVELGPDPLRQGIQPNGNWVLVNIGIVPSINPPVDSMYHVIATGDVEYAGGDAGDVRIGIVHSDEGTTPEDANTVTVYMDGNPKQESWAVQKTYEVAPDPSNFRVAVWAAASGANLTFDIDHLQMVIVPIKVG